MKSLLLYKQKRGYVDMKTLNIYQVGELLTLEFDQTIDNIKNVYVKNEFDEVSFEKTNSLSTYLKFLMYLINTIEKQFFSYLKNRWYYSIYSKSKCKKI